MLHSLVTFLNSRWREVVHGPQSDMRAGPQKTWFPRPSTVVELTPMGVPESLGRFLTSPTPMVWNKAILGWFSMLDISCLIPKMLCIPMKHGHHQRQCSLSLSLPSSSSSSSSASSWLSLSTIVLRYISLLFLMLNIHRHTHVWIYTCMFAYVHHWYNNIHEHVYPSWSTVWRSG